MFTVSLVDNFRENLREAMHRSRLSQSELARLAGVQRATVCNILGGKLEPSVTMCERIAAAAGIRPDLSFIEPKKAS